VVGGGRQAAEFWRERRRWRPGRTHGMGVRRGAGGHHCRRDRAADLFADGDEPQYRQKPGDALAVPQPGVQERVGEAIQGIYGR